jgi:RNAse (barnase) inhibitor barstar
MTTQLTLDGSRWRTEADFYAALLSAIDAPEWHGHNLDALADSLGGGDLNDINPPLSITITGSQSMGHEAQRVSRRFVELCDELAEEGVAVDAALAI